MRTLPILAVLLLASCGEPEPKPVPPPKNPAPPPAEESRGTSIEVDGNGVRIESVDGDLGVSGDSAVIRVEPKR